MRKLGILLFVLVLGSVVVSACNVCSEVGDHDDKYTPGAVSWNVPGVGDPNFYDICIANGTKLKEYFCVGEDFPPAHIKYVCTCLTDPQTGWGYCQQDQIPEFSAVAASIALVGAGAGFIVLRKRR